jgi:2-methylcitrate dehydratase PrpD
MLAAGGITGPTSILTGERGFLHAFSPHPDASQLADFGRKWRTGNVVIKPHCCNARIIPQIDALASILDSNHLAADEIASIEVGTDSGAFKNGTATIGPEPSDIIGMQFSTHFAMALRVITGSNGFDSFYHILTGDFQPLDEITDLARRVSVHVDEDSQALWPSQRRAKVTVRCLDGRLFQSIAIASANHRPDKTVAQDKFRGLARRKLSEEAVTTISDMVTDIEQLDNIRALTDVIISAS